VITAVASRIIQSTAVLLPVALIAFVLFQFVGDPVTMIAGRDTSQAERALLREQLGLNDPVIIRFARFVADAAQGDFGRSYRTSEPVSELIFSRLPATLELSLVATMIAIVLGVGMGVRTAIRPKSLDSQIMMAASLIGIAIPTFFIGIILILVFSVNLGVLPSSGRGETVALGWWKTGFLTVSGWKALVLPATTLAIFQLTLIMRLVRTEMLEVLRTDYVKFARARGLRERVVYYRHALRNTMIPVITVMGLQIGNIIAFSVVTETVFNWPGVGLLFLQSVQFADIPVMSAYLLLVAVIFVTINIIVDVLYFIIDPRIRQDAG
jgi:peptide/nickel transport system permease protein